MNKERIKNYISTITIIFSMFTMAYGLIVIPAKKGLQREINNYKAIALVHEGRLEIEENYKKTGRYQNPTKASVKLVELNFSQEFENRENSTYTYEVLLDGGFLSDGHTYCVNEQGKIGLFKESWDCKL